MSEANSIGPGPHGNPNPTYIGLYKRGCRCEECVAAYKQYRTNYHSARLRRDPSYVEKCKNHSASVTAKFKKEKDRLRTQRGDQRVDPIHASETWTVGHSGYVKGCRCRGCIDGNRQYRRDYQKDNADTCRRAQRRKYERILNDADRKSRVAEKARKRRRMISAWIDDFKTSRGCVDCGYNANSVALDFDHVNGEKAFTISQRRQLSTKSLLKEIAKCQIRCANCHRIRTHERRKARQSLQTGGKQMPFFCADYRPPDSALDSRPPI